MSVTSITRALWLLALIMTCLVPGSRADSMPAGISNPVFIQTPSAPGDIEAQKGFSVNFGYDYDRCRKRYGDNYYMACQPRLELDGKKAVAGITITPAIDGEWRWRGDYSLYFTPSAYWQAGTNYTISLDLDAMGVPARVVLNRGARQAAITFMTNTLAVKFPEMAYMQDPGDPAKKLVSTRLSFNYPVDLALLKEKIRLEMEEENGGALQKSATALTYEIKYNAEDRTAWAATPIKTLPDKGRYLRMIVADGLPPEHGGEATTEAFTERARIPTIDSYLTIQNAAAVIARGEDGAPQQILSFETNVKALPTAALKNARLYLLPAQHPVTKRAKDKKEPQEFYEWKAASEVTPAMLKEAEEIKLQPMKDANGEVTQFGFAFTAPENRYLYLSMGADFNAFGGYTLGRPLDIILQVPAWPHDIEIMQEGSILPLSGARKLSLHARGTDQLRIEVAHIRTEALQHFISQTAGDIRTPSFRNWSFGKEDIAQLDIKDVPMNFTAPHESQYAAFDFSPYLKEGRKGLFLLDIAGMRDDKAVGRAEQRFVLVTDMGLLIKQGGNGSRDVYLVSFTSGKPVANVTVSVLARNGLSVFDGKTDNDGHITLPGMGETQRDREPVAIVAQKDNDYTFIPYDRNDRVLNMSQFETGGAVTPADGMNAFLFTDRGIYRPGETVQIGALVRNADWTALPPGLPLQMVVTDPRGRTVQDTSLAFPTQGLQEEKLVTAENSPTGIYRARLHIANDGRPGNLLGSVSFRVEDFQPDRMKIKTIFTPESRGWVKPDGLGAAVTLTNLYGTPATARRISAAVTLNPAEMSFEGYEDYIFHDSRVARPRTVQYNLPDTTTDSEGKATIALKLDQQEAATYSLNLETRGYESGSGRGVTAYSTLMVSPMDYVVGYKTTANLPYLKKGQDYNVALLALDPALQPVKAEGLSYELVRRTYASTLIKRGDGSYAYESVPREESVKSGAFKIETDGAQLSLPTGDIGAYAWRLKDSDGIIVADIRFAVAGEGQSAHGDREAALDLRIDKPSYKTGEDIEISITAPYAGAGLITLESDHVIAHKWFRTEKTNTVQSIAIPDDFSGKGYVSVSFVRDINSREIYMKPLSYAVTSFIASAQRRTAGIEISAPQDVKPGQPVAISYKGHAKGKAVIYAVDEGILQIARYETPDPVRFFLLDRALQVTTAQMLDLLMPEYELVRELSAKGGDAEAQGAALGKHLNPFKRKNLAPAVYWSGIVDIDTAEKTLNFTPPDHFNGTMRIMAVAVTDDGVGSTERTLTVRGDIVMSANLPLFMAPGDKAIATVTIANNIAGSGDGVVFDLAIPASELFTVTDAPSQITIPENGEKTAQFMITAKDTLGAADLVLRAAHKDTSQETSTPFSIRPATALETTLVAGYSEKGKGEIPLDRALYAAFGNKEATFSPLPTSYIYGLLRYLDGYAYGCTEQVISKAFPQVTLASQSEYAMNTDAAKDKAWQAISVLRQRQTPEGAFSYWDNGNEAEQFVTVYALDFLTTARDMGAPVPQDMIENGLRYIRYWISEDIKSISDARAKAYGIYILTRSGIVTTNEILHVLRYFEDNKGATWQADLTAVYIAAAYQMMQQNALAEKTLGGFEKSTETSDMDYKAGTGDGMWYNPFIKYAQYVSILARHFPDHVKDMDRDVVFNLAGYIRDQRYNTLSSAYAIQALHDYAQKMQAENMPERIEVKADGKKIKAENAVFPLPVGTAEITFSDAGKSVFYTVSESGFDRVTPATAVAHKIEIERLYKNPDGTAVDGTIQAGDIIEAVITARAHGETFENVAIVDLLPGGFDLESDTNSSGEMEFIDRREDRIIAFGTVTPSGKTFRYRMRAVSQGTFIVPPPFAEAMYDPTVKARGVAGEITVTSPE